MLDQLSAAYAQMQPGDKMVMHLHKSPKPPTPQYQVPAGPRDLGPSGAPDAVSAPPAAAVPLAGPDVSLPASPSDPMADRQMLMQALAARIGGIRG